MITHLESDILECEVKWVLGSIIMKKASGGDGIPVKLFQILKDDAVKVLHSICQQIWKTQQWKPSTAKNKYYAIFLNLVILSFFLFNFTVLGTSYAPL